MRIARPSSRFSSRMITLDGSPGPRFPVPTSRIVARIELYGPDYSQVTAQSYKRGCPIKGDVKRNITPLARCRRCFRLGIQPRCLNRHPRGASSLAPACGPGSLLPPRRRGSLPSLQSHFNVVTAPFGSRDWQAGRWQSCQPWSYRRLVAFSFLRSSKCEVVKNVELARQGAANRGVRYFQLHIST